MRLIACEKYARKSRNSRNAIIIAHAYVVGYSHNKLKTHGCNMSWLIHDGQTLKTQLDEVPWLINKNQVWLKTFKISVDL